LSQWTPEREEKRVMNGMKWWMRGVGAFYVLMGLFNTPLIIEARLPAQYPDLGVATDSIAARALIDTWFMFGLEVIVIGLALIYFSRDPDRHVALIWTVIGLELIRGIADDIYLLGRGYEPAFIYFIWILIHTVIILTGLLVLRSRYSQEQSRSSRSEPATQSV
jgi:hypothetical protein